MSDRVVRLTFPAKAEYLLLAALERIERRLEALEQRLR